MSALTPLRFALLLIFLELAFTTISILRAPHVDAFLIGDCPYYAATARSLLHDGDWDLRNQLPGDLENHEGFFAISKDGRIVPKHSTLLPIFSIPFLLLFGITGFLIFNLIQTFLLILGIAQLAGNTPPTRFLAILGYLATPFLAYTYNFAPDILGTALVVWSYVFALRNRWIVCGFVVGLAVWAKVYLALVILPLGLILLPRGWKATLHFAVAAFVALLPMLAINAHLFGAPWITGYDRDARITADGFALMEHYSRFNQPFFAGLGNLLFDERIGLLRTAPLWFLWPVGLWFAERRSAKIAIVGLVAMTLSLLINLFFFACYDEWNASANGNRFLFPAIAIGLALQGPLWEKALGPGKKDER